MSHPDCEILTDELDALDLWAERLVEERRANRELRTRVAVAEKRIAVLLKAYKATEELLAYTYVGTQTTDAGLAAGTRYRDATAALAGPGRP